MSSMAALVQLSGVLLVLAPVGIGLLDDDLALLDQALEDLLDVEVSTSALEADGEVLEVDEDGKGAFCVGHGGDAAPFAVLDRDRGSR